MGLQTPSAQYSILEESNTIAGRPSVLRSALAQVLSERPGLSLRLGPMLASGPQSHSSPICTRKSPGPSPLLEYPYLLVPRSLPLDLWEVVYKWRVRR